MNWVGGARSRVKHFNNNRVQRDYFESKRLAAKLHRLQPSRKKDASQDLYFFNTTVTGKLKPGGSSTKNNKSTKVTRLETRQDIPSMRELELSVSPIGQPSSLDNMDVTVMSSVDQDLSLYGSEYIKEQQPKVSTQKLPHLVKRDHSHRPAIEMATAKDDSTISTELLFPVPKKLRPEISAHSNLHSANSHHSHRSNTHTKNFSIDELLNEPCFNNKSLFPIVSNPPTLATNPHRSEVVVVRGDREVPKRDRQTTTFRGQERKKSKKHQAPYNHHHRPYHHRGQPTENRGSGKGYEDMSNKSVVIYDKDAMLEFHFDEQGLDREESQALTDKYQRVPETSRKQFELHLGPVESSTVPSLAEEGPAMPVVSASNAAHSVWSSASSSKNPCSVSTIGMSENPFSKRYQVHVESDKTDESTESLDHHNITLFNESIFGPIHAKKEAQGGTHVHVPKPVEIEPERATHYGNSLQKPSKKRPTKSSMFERMIHGLETHGEKRIDDEQGEEKKKCEHDKVAVAEEGERQVLKNQEWKNFISGVTNVNKPVDKPQTSEEDVSTHNRSNKQLKDSERVVNTSTSNKSHSKIFRNISVLEELICLEEEIAAEIASQDCPLTPADWTEEPIFTRVQGRERRGHTKRVCEFDSSQESIEANRGSSSNESANSMSSMSTSGCNSSLNQNPRNVLNNPPSPSSPHNPPCSFVSRQNECLCSPTREVPSKERVNSNDCYIVEGRHRNLQSSFDKLTDTADRMEVTSQDTHTLKCNEDIKNLDDDDFHIRSNSKSSAIETETTAQTIIIEAFTKDTSTQWSPVTTSTRTVHVQGTSHAKMQPLALQCGNNLSSEAWTQTVAPFANSLTVSEVNLTSTRGEKVTLVDRGVQDTRTTDYIDQLKKDVERLERELGVAQSTLVWQSLMMRLHQH